MLPRRVTVRRASAPRRRQAGTVRTSPQQAMLWTRAGAPLLRSHISRDAASGSARRHRAFIPSLSERARLRASSNTGSSDSYTVPSAPKTRNRSNERANHRSWVTASDGAVEGLQRLLERLGAEHVEVVGRLVEQQQRGAGQLEQQDLEPRLLAAGQRAERLIALLLQAVSAQRTHRPAAIDAACGRRSPCQSRSTSVRSIHSGWVCVCANRPGHDAGAEPPLPAVRDRLTAEQPQEVRLAGAVRAEHADPLAVVDLGVERAASARSSSSCSQMTARTPVRPPRSRIVTLLVLGLVRWRPGGLEAFAAERSHHAVLLAP